LGSLKNSNKDILLVGHGEFGKMVYAAYYDLDWQQVLKTFNFGNSEVLILSKGVSPDQAHVVKIKQHGR
jgi:broad specificity phosphatase PhoE